ncbi:MAG TPA: nitroreductase family protein [Opitutaceae bacterium]|nr:nitroreductase family protein [Opitutaceae bacterium]
MKRITLLVAMLLGAALAPAQSPLPSAQKTGGLPLMDALAKRATSRAFDPARDLPAQDLSNLLWAAFGINRSDGRRTAPSARNFQETEIYVLTHAGASVYDAASHRLVPIGTEDIRALATMQAFAKDAPVTLVYVVDLARMGNGSREDRRLTAYLDVGFVAQNALLYCASTGLATGVRMMIDRTVLAPKLKLRDTQLIVLAQSVGYPKPDTQP